MSGEYKSILVTIANGQSLSGLVDLGPNPLLAILVPAEFDGSTLTFQGGTANTQSNLYDDAGNEVTVQVAASRCVGIDIVAGALAAIRYLKIRAGTSASPSVQTGDTVLTLLLKG